MTTSTTIRTPTAIEQGPPENQSVKPLPKVRIVVPAIPPSVNHYLRRPRYGRPYKAPKTVRFEEAFGYATMGMQRLPGSVYRVRITLYLGRNDSIDWANSEKVIGDCLERRGIIEDDKLIRHGSIDLEDDWENPRTEIELEAVR